jgi:UDP-N-acetylmuramate dehydrogenase
MIYEKIEKNEDFRKSIKSVDCSTLSSLKIKGACPYLFLADSIEKLKAVLNFCQDESISFHIIGSGTNILLSDQLKDVLLIKLSGSFDYVKRLSGPVIECGASYPLGKLVVWSAKEGLDLSFLSGIPGTVGGAVIGNSGTAKEGICDFVKSVRGIFKYKSNLVYKEKMISKEDFSYRAFRLKGLMAVTGITLRPSENKSDIIFKIIRKTIRSKKERQPINTKNIGCFFKNPSSCTYSAGQLIDICGLKGFKYGGAMVSEKHANFLENHENATASDILDLSRILIGHVRENFGIHMDYEIKMIGFK